MQERKGDRMALNREQVQLKVKEILEKAKRENNVLTYQDMMNALAELDIDAEAIDAVFDILESEGLSLVIQNNTQ